MAQADKLSLEAASQLRRCVQTGKPIDAAQIKVIGLEAVREAAGARWPVMADRVRETSLNFIRACVEADDVVIPAGDGFLVIYAGKPGRDCDRDSAALYDALNAFYLGEEGMQSLRASVERRTMDASAMEDLIWTDEPAPAPPPPPALKLAKKGVAFAPLWSAKLEVIGAYFATPVHSEAGETRLGYDSHYLATGRHSSSDFLDQDLEVLDLALEGAEEVDALGLRCIVGFCVHATTLQRRTHWAVYQARLARAPPALRTWLSARICEIEPGTPGVSLAEWVTRLNGAASTVALGLHHTDQAIGHLQSTRANAVSVTLSERGMGARNIVEHSRRLIDRWAPALHRQRLGLCLEGVDRQELLAYACDARVDAITGIKFWPLVGTPSGAWTITRAELLGKSAAPLAR